MRDDVEMLKRYRLAAEQGEANANSISVLGTARVKAYRKITLRQ